MAGVLMVRAATGPGLTQAGTGARITPGVGRPSIMVAGINIVGAAGSGFPIAFGVRRGCPGGVTAIIADGRHCRRTRCIAQVLALVIMVAAWMSASASALVMTPFVSRLLDDSIVVTFTIIACRATKCIASSRSHTLPTASNTVATAVAKMIIL
jgi:hypothetical protein